MRIPINNKKAKSIIIKSLSRGYFETEELKTIIPLTIIDLGTGKPIEPHEAISEFRRVHGLDTMKNPLEHER
ncbi:hypothetical protein [Plebeiibacterium sediminum]|uniref:Uncharacterized protein n=1 Tax=Plebeiibacterium sediminum TaxID=2992112 RepID=A0AAE3SHP3_9BACT|nr:hypothetical protein [Plebeiobacterium sediminum]MCW3789467.1 hypothetical protein [Plebeiobacterium sediminum]